MTDRYAIRRFEELLAAARPGGAVSGRSPASVEEVKERADIVELVRADTELRKPGVEWTGRCPFHEERSPSFWVNPAKKVYYCFGCGASGDVIAYVEQRQALDFTAAVEWLADRFDVELEYEEVEPGGRRAPASARTGGASCCALTAAFYDRAPARRARWPSGARAYLDERGVTAGDGSSSSGSASRPTREQVIDGGARARASPIASSRTPASPGRGRGGPCRPHGAAG